MKTKSLLLVSVLSLLPLTSMGAPDAGTGVVTSTTQKGTVTSTAKSGTQSTNALGDPLIIAGPAATQKGSSAPGENFGQGGYIVVSTPDPKAGTATAPTAAKKSTAPGNAPAATGGVGASGFTPTDLKAPTPPK